MFTISKLNPDDVWEFLFVHSIVEQIKRLWDCFISEELFLSLTHIHYDDCQYALWVLIEFLTEN